MWPDAAELVESIQNVPSSTPSASRNAEVHLSHRTSTSQLQPHDDAGSLRRSSGLVATFGGLSPSLHSHRSSVDQPLQHNSDKCHRASCETSPNPLKGPCTGGAPTSQAGLSLLPPLVGMMSSRSELFTEFAALATQSMNERQKAQKMSPSPADAAQPQTPQCRVDTTPRTLSPRASSVLDSFGPSGPTTGLLVGSPMGENLSNTALRGCFLPESLPLAESSASSVPHSALRLHCDRERDRLNNGDDSSDMAGGRNGSVLSQAQLPLITSSLTSTFSSFQGRQLNTTLQEPEASGAANESKALSCSSPTSYPHEDEAPRVAPALKVVTEASTAVGQPPRSLYPEALPRNKEERCDAKSIKPSDSAQSSHCASALDSSTDNDARTGVHQLIPLEASDRCGGTDTLATAPVRSTTEAAPLTPTGDVTGRSSSRNSSRMGPTICARTPASPFARNAIATPMTIPGLSRLDTAFLESGYYTPGVTRPPTGECSSGPKHGSLQSLDHNSNTTTACRVTGPQRHSDSLEDDDVAHQKLAKRHLKKTRRKSKAKRQKNGETVVDGEAVKAAGHKSESALARKRERKRQLKHEEMKDMPSEERRRYKAEHQRRRAAKKAMRFLVAATSPHRERGDHGDCSSSKAHHSGDPSPPEFPVPVPTEGALNQPPALSFSPELPEPSAVATTGVAHPDAKTTSSRTEKPSSNSEVENSVPCLDDRPSLENLAETLSRQVFSSTCSAPNNALGNGGSSLLKALQGRRCTSASDGAPALPSRALPSTLISSTMAPFRRRFFSDTASRPQSQGVADCSVHVSSGTLTNVGCPKAHLQAYEADVEGFGLERDAAFQANGGNTDSYDDGESRGPLCRPPMEESDVILGVSPGPSSMSNRDMLSLVPHLPASAAGSGTAAILGLKQQQEVQQRPQLHSPTAGTLPLSTLVSMVNTRDDVASPDVSKASSITASDPEGGVDPCQKSSLPLRTGVEASQSAEPCLNQLRTSNAVTGPAANGMPAKSVTSSCCSAYSPSCAKAREPAEAKTSKSAVGGKGSDAGQNDPTPAAAASAAVAVARKAGRSLSSSCSSFRSRSSDDESADGSSVYSYSNYSSSGSLVPEVLPLVEDCTVPPPVAAFSDLKYRCSCVPQLRSYAEPAIIHEWNLTEGCWGRVETSVVLSPKPFSKGNMRASYYMIDMGRLNCLLVAKRYLKSNVRDDQYFDDVSMHSIAGHWARVFNMMHPPKEVRFVPAAVLILPKRNPPLIMAMEPQLTGKFVKYNNNCGYVRRKARWTPQAFSHFTYHASDHELMVVDIQGVDDYYTDPQILSPDGEGYGRGNLGKEGIQRFLESHRCNEVCRAVGLPPLRRNSKGAVITPLASSGSGRSSAGPGSPVIKDRLTTAVPCASGLKEERLPPKAFMLARRASSGNSPCLEPNGAQLSLRQSSEAAQVLVPAPPPRQTLHRGSRPPSPLPPEASPSALTPSSLPHSMVPVPNYGVKYVRYPRQALIRPQSQYFVSTVAGGLMAVPQQGSGMPNGYGNGGPFSPLHMYSTANEQNAGKVGGAQAGASAGAPSSMVAVGHTGVSTPPQGAVMMAVPLLRPPAGARPGYAGAQSNVSPEGFLLSTQRSGESAGSLHQTPHLWSGGTANLGGGMPSFYPHPPVTGTVGSPTGRCGSHQSSFAAVAPTMPSAEEAAMLNSAQLRRRSFSRQPLFSAVEEAPKKSKSRYHRHPHLH